MRVRGRIYFPSCLTSALIQPYATTHHLTVLPFPERARIITEWVERNPERDHPRALRSSRCSSASIASRRGAGLVGEHLRSKS